MFGLSQSSVTQGGNCVIWTQYWGKCRESFQYSILDLWKCDERITPRCTLTVLTLHISTWQEQTVGVTDSHVHYLSGKSIIIYIIVIKNGHWLLNNTSDGHHHASISLLCLAGRRWPEFSGRYMVCFSMFSRIDFGFGFAAAKVESTKTATGTCSCSTVLHQLTVPQGFCLISSRLYGFILLTLLILGS